MTKKYWKTVLLVGMVWGLLSGCLYDEAAKTCFDFTAENDAQAENDCSTSSGSTSSGTIAIISLSPLDEVVVILNQGLSDENLTGWVLGPENAVEGESYMFPSFSLFPGKVVRVHSSDGGETDTATDLYWEGSDHWAVEDTALLKDANGNTIDSCSNTEACWGG